MEPQWIVLIFIILFILIVTILRLCFLMLNQKVMDKNIELPSKLKPTSKSSIQSNGSIKSLIKNPNKVDELMNWMTDTPHKGTQTNHITSSEGTQTKAEEWMSEDDSNPDFKRLSSTWKTQKYIGELGLVYDETGLLLSSNAAEEKLESTENMESESIDVPDNTKDFTSLKPSSETNECLEMTNGEKEILLSNSTVEKAIEQNNLETDYNIYSHVTTTTLTSDQYTASEVKHQMEEKSDDSLDEYRSETVIDLSPSNILIEGNEHVQSQTETEEAFYTSTVTSKSFQEGRLVANKSKSSTIDNVQITDVPNHHKQLFETLK